MTTAQTQMSAETRPDLGPDIVEGLAIPAAGLANSGHGPGPRVGRDAQVPSQPITAAGAGPDFSCTGALEQSLKPQIGKMCRTSVGASVARSVARSGLVGLSIPLLGCSVWGRLWGLGLGVSGDPGIIFWVSPTLLASCLLSSALYVRACWHDSSVESRLASRAPISLSVSPWLARGVQSPVVRCGCSLLHHARATSARSALSACFGGWGCGVF